MQWYRWTDLTRYWQSIAGIRQNYKGCVRQEAVGNPRGVNETKPNEPDEPNRESPPTRRTGQDDCWQFRIERIPRATAALSRAELTRKEGASSRPLASQQRRPEIRCRLQLQ